MSFERRPPRSTSEYLNFLVEDRSSWDGMERQTLRAATPLIRFRGRSYRRCRSRRFRAGSTRASSMESVLRYALTAAGMPPTIWYR